MSTARFIVGDVFESLAALKAEGTQVDLVMTSPPFLALRSYLPADHPDKGKEIGSEPTPAEFLTTMLDVVEACADVLAPHGSICFEFGDTYAGSGGAGGDYNAGGLREGQTAFSGSAAKRAANGVGDDYRPARSGRHAGAWPLDKSLCMIPELFAASLAYGRNLLDPARTTDPWRIRNTVAWVRPNPPVGALGDKVRPAKSLLTWATKARDRWFDLDAVRTEHANPDNRHERADHNLNGRDDGQRTSPYNPAGAPPLDWWKISPGGYSGSHYAVMPPEVCRIPIEASCPRRVCLTCGEPSRRQMERSAEYAAARAAVGDFKAGRGRSGGLNGTTQYHDGKHITAAENITTGWTTCGCPGTDGIRLDGYHTGPGWRPGIVLDPFGGSGTTGLVATGLSRAAILIDLDERNLDLARERIGMFLEAS